MSVDHLVNVNKVLVLSRDEKLINAFDKNSSEEAINSDSNNDISVIDSFSDLDSIGASNTIVYDVDLIDGDFRGFSKNISLIHQLNREAAIVLVGKKETVKEALKKKSTKLAVSRSIYKPVIASKLHIVLKLVAPQEATETLSETVNSSSSRVRYIVALTGALVLIAGASWFMSREDKSELAVSQPQENTPQSSTSSAEPSELELKINNLLNLGNDALEREALILPERDNALHYFNNVIELDTYNTRAYDGKQKVLEALRESLPKLLQASDFTQAELVINSLVDSEPFNEDNPRMKQALQEQIALSNNELNDLENTEPNPENQAPTVDPVITDAQVDAESQQQEEQQKRLLQQKEEQAKLARGQALASQIRNAIEEKRLIAPASDNAYSLLRGGLQNNVISTSEFSSLKQDLANALVETAKQQISDSEISQANQYVAYLRSLDKSNAQLPQLIASIKTAEQEALAVKQEALAIKRAEPEAKPDSVTPQTESDKNTANATTGNDVAISATNKASPVVISNKYQPDYPRRALNFSIEGWVEVEYQVNKAGKAVNVKALQSEPKRIFNTAGVNAVKRWEFEPAKDSAGNPILSEKKTTTFNFSLDDT